MKTHKTFLLLSCTLFSYGCFSYGCVHEPVLTEKPMSDSVVVTVGALVLNELMYEPSGAGVEYLELVNVSDSAVDLSAYSVCLRNSAGELNKRRPLSEQTLFLNAEEYLVLTSDTALLRNSYDIPPEAVCLSVKSFPALSNNGATVVVVTGADRVVDECSYVPDFHHPFLSQTKDVSLEKLHPSLPSREAASWASASSDAGYATPGRRNSQWRDCFEANAPDNGLGEFFLVRDWLRPLSSDTSALLPIAYRGVSRRHAMSRIEVFSRYGQKVSTPVDNALLGESGCYQWYGTDDAGELLPAGHYLLKTVIFDLDGNVASRSFACFLLY